MTTRSPFFLLQGLLLPFFGTALGSAVVFFARPKKSGARGALLNGFAGGVMLAAAVWSLLIPSVERGGIVRALVGFFLGIGFLLALDLLLPIPPEAGRRSIFAVTVHNLPEGMAVGVAFAAALQNVGSTAAALALALGIAIQNFPEGAIVSLPVHAGGKRKSYAFLVGVLSGAIEPIGAAVALLASRETTLLLPYLLSFAAGAMFYVVPEELITPKEGRLPLGTLGLSFGFCVMMTLDILLS